MGRTTADTGVNMDNIKSLLRNMPTFFLTYLVIAIPFIVYALGTMLWKLGFANLLIGVGVIGVGFVIAKFIKKWANQ